MEAVNDSIELFLTDEQIEMWLKIKTLKKEQ